MQRRMQRGRGNLPAASSYFRDDQKLFFRFVRNSTRAQKSISAVKQRVRL